MTDSSTVEVDEQRERLDVVEVAGQRHHASPAFLVAADSQLARQLPTGEAPARVLRLSESLAASSEVDSLRTAAMQAAPVSLQAPDTSTDPVTIMRWAALAGSALVALGVVALGLQAGGIAPLGGALAVPAGALPTVGVLISRSDPVLPMPWPALLVALVAVPATRT